MPMLFPRRFPLYRTRDLGLLMLERSMDVAPDGSTNDPEYQKKLTKLYRPKEYNSK
jgi:hypothetical protein